MQQRHLRQHKGSENFPFQMEALKFTLSPFLLNYICICKKDHCRKQRSFCFVMTSDRNTPMIRTFISRHISVIAKLRHHAYYNNGSIPHKHKYNKEIYLYERYMQALLGMWRRKGCRSRASERWGNTPQNAGYRAYKGYARLLLSPFGRYRRISYKRCCHSPPTWGQRKDHSQTDSLIIPQPGISLSRRSPFGQDNIKNLFTSPGHKALSFVYVSGEKAEGDLSCTNVTKDFEKWR